jgi:hypothetical protein
MDPSILVNMAALVIQGTKEVVDRVDDEIKRTAAKNEALQHLRDALACLGGDTEFYRTLLETPSRGGATGSPPLG